jgi:hypothetical protein
VKSPRLVLQIMGQTLQGTLFFPRQPSLDGSVNGAGSSTFTRKLLNSAHACVCIWSTGLQTTCVRCLQRVMDVVQCSTCDAYMHEGLHCC